MTNTNTETLAMTPVLDHWRDRAEQCLLDSLPKENTIPQSLHQAMRYAVLNGGKRVRPLLSYAAAHALEIQPEQVDIAGCAVELIHAYSLVHDDLPAMDDDDLRRGKPTCHKVYGEAEAILVGDALQSLAFHLLAHKLSDQIPADQKLQMIDLLALASGSRGMAGGQSIDLNAVGKSLNIAELENMHIHKTGALIRASVKLGALCCPNVDTEKLSKLDHFAKQIGLAFQIRDDILDVEGDTARLGKTQGADIARNKPTYPALMGLEAAKEMAEELYYDALNSLDVFAENAKPLRELSRYIVQRDY